MTKQILPLLLVLGFTSCNERQPRVHTASTNVSSSISNNTSAPIFEEEEPVISTSKPTQAYIRTPIPMLDDEIVSTETKRLVNLVRQRAKLFQVERLLMV